MNRPFVQRLCLVAFLILISSITRAAQLDDADLERRIDALRKGDFVVHVADESGHPINGSVSYDLTRHAFQFGTAVNADFVLHPSTPDDLKHYEQIVTRYFNYAVEENAMKWHSMEPRQGKVDTQTPLAIWQWCHDRGIPMRGHCIFWGVEQWVPKWIKPLTPEQTRDAMQQRLRSILTLMNGKIDEWDLNNEMLHDDYIARKLGLKTGAEYFKWAHAIAPNVRFCVNDYTMQEGREADYVQHIRAMLDDGAKIDGIGEQCHFHGVPDNETVWHDLDQLAQFKLPITITEFDDDTADEQVQAENLERFYKVCFAHPSVKAILMWGFWEGRHWRAGAALWRRDWSAKPNGDAYMRLMNETFHTEGTAEVKDGTLKFRGFFGDYTIKAGDRSAVVSLTQKNLSVTVILKAP